jgi:SAM-dependent methyltransferase
MSEAAQGTLRRLAWAAARLAHRADFAWLLPALAALPIGAGQRLARWRGEFNGRTGRDWRSMGLGFRHIWSHSLQAYGLLGLGGDAEHRRWRRERFIAEARDEYEARLVAAGRVDELECEVLPSPEALAMLRGRQRGLVLLTPHFESFFLGVAFLARSGAKVNLMSSAVTHDPRVDAAVQRHFTAKYRGLERYLNGGKVVDLELGSRQFYRMLQRGEVLVILGDAPVLPAGVAMTVDFLGAARRLAGGPLKMARATGSDLGGYVCRHLGGARYQLELSPIGSAEAPGTVQGVYDFFSRAILAQPGGWWASDLLPAMPVVPPEAPARSVETILLTDSAIASSEELALGLRQLRAALQPVSPAGWHEQPAGERSPAAVLQACTADRLLVLLEPSLLCTPGLVAELGHALQAGAAACAMAADPRTAEGEWGVTYTTLGDFEAYVARRAALPVQAPAPAHAPHAYMLDVALARALLQQQPALGWHELPAACGAAAVLAPRAFVHSYAGYQQNTREEMLGLLPDTVQQLLDVGGGEGGFAHAFVRQRGAHAWLVEPSAAADRAPAHERLQVFRGLLEQFDPAHEGRFDAVSCLDVLEHLVDPLALLRQARRFLKPGGLLLVSVPNAGHWSVVRDLMNGRFDYLPVGILCGTHLRFFTARSLGQLLDEAGFEAVQWRRAGPSLPPPVEAFAAAAAQAGIALDRESLATESLHVLARAR